MARWRDEQWLGRGRQWLGGYGQWLGGEMGNG